MEFFEKENSPSLGHKESAKARPLGQKNSAKPHPGEIIFKNTEHETKIIKNSTEMLLCLEILKQ